MTSPNKIPGETRLLPQRSPTGEELRSFIPVSVPPPAQHPAEHDCSFSQAQFQELRAIASSMPAVATAASKLAHVAEAVASCEIEGIVSTTAQVLKHLAHADTPTHEVAQVIACRDANLIAMAMTTPSDHAGSWPKRTFTFAHKVLHQNDPDWRAATKPGVYRIQQNFIGSRTVITHVPPPQHEVPQLMEELNHWMCQQPFREMPLTMQMALSHYQFETIHPFPDGNGRTGRAMNAALAQLAATGGTPIPWTMSTYLLADQADYYRVLREPRNTGSWTGLIEFFDVCLSNDAMRWHSILQRMECAFNEWNAIKLPERTSNILPSLLANPYITTKRITREHQCSNGIARAILNDLSKAGIIKETPTAGNAKMYLASQAARAAGFPH